MSDHLDSESRSKLMRRVRGKDTKPELVVRRLAHALGYRFRLHRPDLPGHPDIVFPSKRKIVFVHGCFWHRHQACQRASTPMTRREFWEAKFDRNRDRDARKERELRQAGWDVLVLWECETNRPQHIVEQLQEFLGPPGSNMRRRLEIQQTLS